MWGRHRGGGWRLIEVAEFSAGEEALAKGGEGGELGGIAGFLAGLAAADLLWETHPEGADGGELIGGRCPAEGEAIGVSEPIQGAALLLCDAACEGICDGDGLWVIEEEEALGGDVGGFPLAIDEAGVWVIEDGQDIGDLIANDGEVDRPIDAGI